MQKWWGNSGYKCKNGNSNDKREEHNKATFMGDLEALKTMCIVTNHHTFITKHRNKTTNSHSAWAIQYAKSYPTRCRKVEQSLPLITYKGCIFLWEMPISKYPNVNISISLILEILKSIFRSRCGSHLMELIFCQIFDLTLSTKWSPQVCCEGRGIPTSSIK